MRATPETDEHARPGNGYQWETEVVPAEFARKLERRNAELEEAAHDLAEVVGTMAALKREEKA